jgi:hypothetical protein
MRDPQFFVDTAAPDHAQNVEAAADARIGPVVTWATNRAREPVRTAGAANGIEDVLLRPKIAARIAERIRSSFEPVVSRWLPEGLDSP